MPGDTPLTLSDWHLAYQAGGSPRELLSALRSRLMVESPENAWISHVTAAQLDAQLSVLEAREATHRDRESALRTMPLFGVPFAVKDNIDVAEAPTTAACPAFEYVAAAHSTVVARLLDAGAVWMGKTNLDQFATGLVGARSPYGRPSQHLCGRSCERRLELGLGGGGRRAASCRSRSAPTPRARGACRPASTTSSG